MIAAAQSTLEDLLDQNGPARQIRMIYETINGTEQAVEVTMSGLSSTDASSGSQTQLPYYRDDELTLTLLIDDELRAAASNCC